MNRNKKWSVEEENKLRELLSLKKYSFEEMAKFFDNRMGRSLGHRAKKLGLNNKDHKSKKYSHDEMFFETPNPINSYIAGFYAADGSVYGKSTAIVSLAIHGNDSHQLQKFKEYFKYDGIISKSKRDNLVTLRIYSADKWHEDLYKNFNLASNKTYRLPPPNLQDKDLILCYIAGLLDGDGSVFISGQNTLAVCYTSSSLLIMEWVKNQIEILNLKILRNRDLPEIRKCNHANAYEYRFTGSRAIHFIKIIQDLAKKYNLPILKRKWDNDKLNNYISEFLVRNNIDIKSLI